MIPHGTVEISKWFAVTLDGTLYSTSIPNTLEEAWAKTINKWDLVANFGFVPFDDVKSCGLCNMFFYGDEYKEGCAECPIYESDEWGNHFRCNNTPYNDIQELEVFLYPDVDGDNMLAVFADLELQFLLELRDAGQSKHIDI